MLVVLNTALISCHCDLNMWFMTGADDSVTLVIMWVFLYLCYCWDRWHNHFDDGVRVCIIMYLLYCWDILFNIFGDYLEKECVCLDSMCCWDRWLSLW